MHAYMSAVHGVMDLEVGCVWRSYGEIYYLTDEQELLPQVQHALARKWLVRVSDAEVKYASMDSRKVVGPKPPVPPRPIAPLSAAKADPSIDALRQDIARLTNEVGSIRQSSDMESVKSDIIQLNKDLNTLATSIQSIVDILSKGVPVAATQTRESTGPSASISEQIVEDLFIPTFKLQNNVSIEAESEKVNDQSSSDALEQLKKLRKKKGPSNG